MRIKLTIQYDGTNFFGYQKQDPKRTIQDELEKVLQTMHRKPVQTFASGRTDSFVHALGQVVHFDTTLDLKEDEWLRAFRAMLPDDIKVIKAERVSNNFHSRFDAKKKVYQYIILNDEQHDLFRRHYEWHVPYKLSIDRMIEASKHIVGTHDFTAFSSSKTNVKGDKTRTIYDLSIKQDDNRIIIEVTGNGFLTHMVRIIAGTLVDIGTGKKSIDCITEAFETKDRNKLGITAPGHGLYLKEVIY